METYHWDVLATFHGDVVGCFIWDVTATSLGRTERRRYHVATTSCCRVGLFIILFWSLMWWWIFLDVFGYKIDNFLYFFFYGFAFLHNSSVRIGSSYFHSYFTCFLESLKIRNNYWILATSLIVKNVNMSFFEYYAVLLFFFRSCIAAMVKNNPTEKQTDV